MQRKKYTFTKFIQMECRMLSYNDKLYYILVYYSMYQYNNNAKASKI